ncbi:MAG: CRISPR-associated endonuclease Cas2 [Treponema sp.]|uniref:CRISPR-associated endonuclease Cas2 n=1 Tax=Treponema sp. TaxID=166 RepID=UPI00298E59A1|nr:CRISPR-associated endonuclease Cas2 [Treponema sp.]MCQ2601880.1 CRISPR-associated endonuclease Cas2 [Treponema sp.]
MRILVMLNPTNRYGTKTAYTELRKFLLSDGYLKTQPDVFMRVEDTKKSCLKHKNRIKSYLPPTGEVRMLILTERQFEGCILCQEKPDLQEKLVGAKDLVTL